MDVLNGTFDPTRVAGKRVIIGATAVELGDEVACTSASPAAWHRSAGARCGDAASTKAHSHHRRLAGRPAWLIALAVGCLSKLQWRHGTAIALAGAVLVLGIALVLHLAAATSLHTSPILLNILLGALAAQLDRQVSTILAQRLALRRKEAVMGRLVDAVFDGIVVFDDQGKVLSWNRAAEHVR